MNRVRRFGSGIGFVWNKNLWRLIALLAVFGPDRAQRHRHARDVGVHRSSLSAPATRDPARVRAGRSASSSSPGSCLVPVPAAEVHGHAGRRPDRDDASRTTAASPTCSSTPRARSASCAASRSSSSAAARCPRACCSPAGRAPARRSSPRASPRRRTCRSSTSTRARSGHVHRHDRADGHEAVPRRPRPGPASTREPGKRGACIMFMDEIDSIGMSRGGQGGGGMVMGGMMGGGGAGASTRS